MSLEYVVIREEILLQFVQVLDVVKSYESTSLSLVHVLIVLCLTCLCFERNDVLDGA